MYETFYGLKIKPFTLVPNPDFLYRGDTHRLAMATLMPRHDLAAPLETLVRNCCAAAAVACRAPQRYEGQLDLCRSCGWADVVPVFHDGGKVE